MELEHDAMRSVVVAGHQPNFFPWFGYFEKMLKADIFVFSDDVQYTKQNLVNRVAIPVGKGTAEYNWVLPVTHGGDASIAQKTYIKDEKTLKKMLRTIAVNLGGLPHYDDVAAVIEVFRDAYWRHGTMADLNIAMISHIARSFGIDTPTRRGTELELQQWHGTERLVRRLQVLNADTYLSGQGAHEYTDDSMFAANGLKLVWIDYTLGPELFGEELKYSTLVGIGRLGLRRISEAVRGYRAQAGKTTA